MPWKIILVVLILMAPVTANAGNFGFGGHGGFGAVTYEEDLSSGRSRAELSTVIFGVSGEYSFERYSNLFAGITTDWTVGLGDKETMKKNGREFRTNDLRMFGQFYDMRFGYKGSAGGTYYRVHLSGGWDGIRLSRSDVNEDGKDRQGSFRKDYSLWRAGVGAGLGHKFGPWAVDGRAAYSFYPKGTAKDSEFSGAEFRTGGTCVDLGFGMVRELADDMNLYAGVSYTLIKLDGDRDGGGAELPESRTRMLFGVVNLTRAF